MSFDIITLIEKAKKKEYFTPSEYLSLCDVVMEIFLEESNVIDVASPVSIIGDIHGQFYDLLQIFKIGGDLPHTQYIFLGDYVDRGYYSLETITLLLCYKARYPSRIVLLRGNHESRTVTTSYGFYDECYRKYGDSIEWLKSMELFDCMPLAAVVNNNILCVHGGLSPDLTTLSQIQMLPRQAEIPTTSGPFSDLMWSDPDDSVADWAISQRGCGHNFGERVAKEFNYVNELDLIVRAHQLVMQGYKYPFLDNSVVTVWSAPNYCYRCGNIGAILQVNDANVRDNHFVIFSEVPDAQRTTPPKTVVKYFM